MRFIDIRAEQRDFEKGHAFIEDLLIRNSIPGEIISETMLIFEALFHNLTARESEDQTLIRIVCQDDLGDIRIKVGFEGKLFDPLNSDDDINSPENRILRAYADKIDHSYRSGYNSIRISVRRSYRKTLLLWLTGIALAVAVYIPIHLLAGNSAEERLLAGTVFPLETLFANAILMVGAPVTFFSLLKHLTDAFIVSERSIYARRLQLINLLTSIAAVLLAFAVSFGIAGVADSEYTYLEGYQAFKFSGSFAEAVSSLIPENIFAPFETISPFPLIIVTLLIAYALCSVGKYFDVIKTAINAGYVLCSRMLAIVVFTLPAFAFIAVLDVLLSGGAAGLLHLAELLALMLASLICVVAMHAVRLKGHGVRIRAFLKKLVPLLKENFRINSAIDAVPYNIRYCARNYGLDRRMLEESMPTLAQINLEGNCYMITTLALVLLLVSGADPAWADIVTIGALVLFLSLGAPNQPGSWLIGLQIILRYLNAMELIPIAIIAEVFLGGALNLVNVLGDVVFVTAEDARSKRSSGADLRKGDDRA